MLIKRNLTMDTNREEIMTARVTCENYIGTI